MKTKRTILLTKRLFEFAVRVIKFLRTIPENKEYRVIYYQLVKSATSSGANYEEAQAGSSRADFANKVNISLKEMRESNYWLRIINDIEENNINKKELEYLINESKELMNILGSITSKIKRNNK